MRGPRDRRLSAAVVVALLAIGSVAACSGGGQKADKFEELSHDTKVAGWSLRAGVEMVTVFDARPGEKLSLYDKAGTRLATLPADAKGRAHFAYIPDDPD